MRSILFSACLGVSVMLSFPARGGEPAAGRALRLDEVMALARDGNWDARLARERLLEASGAVKSSRAKLLPELDGEISQKRQDRAIGEYGLPESATATIPDPIEGSVSYDAPDAIVDRFDLPTKTSVEFPDPIPLNLDYGKTTRTYNWFGAQLRLNAPLVNIRDYRAYKAQSADEARAAQEVALAEEQAMYAAASAFLRVLLADASVRSQERLMELQARRVAYYEDQYKANLTTELELMRERQALDHEKGRLHAARRNRLQQARDLATRIGGSPESPPDVDGALAFSEWTPPSAASALDEALTRRPDLLAQQERARSARLQRDAARADSYPNARAFGAYGLEGERYSDTVETWMIGAALTVPIWDSFGRKGRLEQAAGRLAQTENRTEALRAQITTDVLGALDAWELAREEVELARGAVRLAEENLRFREDQAAAGVAGPMDVCAAEIDLVNARQKEQEALYRVNAAGLSYWAAVGDVEQYLASVGSTTESRTTPEPAGSE